MKKILLSLLVSILSFQSFGICFAWEFWTSPALGWTTNVNWGASAASSQNSQQGWNGIVPIDTTNVTTESIQSSQNITPTNGSSTNILNYGNNITDTDLREWNVSMDTIPLVLVSIINVLLWVAGTISIVALIYYAVQMQINSGITGDSSWVDNAKRWMKWAILGFIVAILAWFIVIRFVEILSSMS